MRRTIIFFIILFYIGLISAQNHSLNVLGTIINDKQEPIPYASVRLSCDSSVLSGAITNDKGKFFLKSGNCSLQYHLTIEAIGYISKTIPITPTSERFEVGKVVLDGNRQMIEGISVTANAEDKKMNVEHTTINASTNVTASQGNVVDILRSAAAVTVDNDGNVSIRGNNNVLVLLDGVPTTMTDLTALPAANVQNVEVITNPDASYDAEGTGGIINVVNIFQPQVVCLGGGVSNQQESLINPIKEYLDKEDYARHLMKRVTLKIATFRNDAGIIGAAMLGVYNA
jgi:hypothetical protein